MSASNRTAIDAWRTATWRGAKQEAMRRWAQLPLEQIIAAQEEMQELARALGDNKADPQAIVADTKTSHNL